MIYTNKLELRETLLKRRLMLLSSDKKKYDASIIEKAIFALEVIKPNVTHIFQTILDKGEIDTSPLFKWTLDAGIAVYSTVKIEGQWQMARFETVKRFWPEKPASLDVIIVPMLGFDNNLHRVGYGGGYYDKIAQEYSRAQRLGLAYELQHVENIQTETHDKPLDSIITEAEVYTKNH